MHRVFKFFSFFIRKEKQPQPVLDLSFDSQDFVPTKLKKVRDKTQPSTHPILGARSFPDVVPTLSAIENLSSNKRQKTIGSLVRKAIKAVQPGVRGKCVNNSWAKSVTVARLKTQTAISLVGDREFFSLEDFLPWAKMNLKCFNSGPRPLDYLIPVTSWEAFQVIK